MIDKYQFQTIEAARGVVETLEGTISNKNEAGWTILPSEGKEHGFSLNRWLAGAILEKVFIYTELDDNDNPSISLEYSLGETPTDFSGPRQMISRKYRYNRADLPGEQGTWSFVNTHKAVCKITSPILVYEDGIGIIFIGKDLYIPHIISDSELIDLLQTKEFPIFYEPGKLS